MSEIPEMLGSIKDWEQSLRQIKSVIAVRINANNQGIIEEIHILSDSDRAAKQIVRDVESILATQFNLYVDHKKISVAQVEDDEKEEGSFITAASMRPKLVGVTLRTVNGQADVRVELLTGDKIMEGIAQGPATARNNLRLFVEATLNALSPLTLDKFFFVAEDVGITQLAKQHIALVYITLITSAGEQSLAGCALVRSDDREALVRATLNAVNRKLMSLRDN